MTITEAIAHFEGFYTLGCRPQRNNNPGDLEYRSWQVPYGATGSDGRFAIFGTSDEGFSALKSLLGFPRYKGKTIAEAINIFAPGFENNTDHYVKTVCLMTGLTPDTIIDNYL